MEEPSARTAVGSSLRKVRGKTWLTPRETTGCTRPRDRAPRGSAGAPPRSGAESRRDHRQHEGSIRCCPGPHRSEEHTSELQSRSDLVCRLLLEKKKK